MTSLYALKGLAPRASAAPAPAAHGCIDHDPSGHQKEGLGSGRKGMKTTHLGTPQSGPDGEKSANAASSQNPTGKPQKLAKWRQEEIENQKKLIRFLLTPSNLRGEEEAKIQLSNIRDSRKQCKNFFVL